MSRYPEDGLDAYGQCGQSQCSQPSAGDYCDGTDAFGSADVDEGCGYGEYGCKARDQDDFPVRFSSGRVEANRISILEAGITNALPESFGYSVTYGSHHGRWPAVGSGGPPLIRADDQDTHFLGYGFLDSYSDRVLKRGSQYAWVSQADIVTFEAQGNGTYRSRGNRYSLIDHGTGATPRIVISTTSPRQVRQRWSFDTFAFSATPSGPANELYSLDSYSVAADATGAGGYGWNVVRLGSDGRIQRVADSLGRELRFIYETVGSGRHHRLKQVLFATGAADVGQVVATLAYYANNSLERITTGPGHYTRFRYDKTNVAWCRRCAYLLTEVIVPTASTTTPAAGSPSGSGEIVSEGHQFEYYTAADGAKAYRARKSYGPSRAWFYEWPTSTAGTPVRQLDLKQPQMSGGSPVACGLGCSSGFGCYPLAKGGNQTCYVEKTFAVDGSTRNLIAASGVHGGTYTYDSSRAPRSDTDSAGVKTTYAYDVNGDVICSVVNDDDDSALSNGNCVGPAGSKTVSFAYGAGCPGVPGSVASTVATTVGLLGAGDRIDTKCFDGRGLVVGALVLGRTRSLGGSTMVQQPVVTLAYDAFGRLSNVDGPLPDSVAWDKIELSYHGDQSAASDRGRVHVVTQHVGNAISRYGLSVAYSEYDLYGNPLRLDYPNSETLHVTSSADRLTWTSQMRNGAAVVAQSEVRMNPDGTVHWAKDADGLCTTYEYADGSGAATKTRRATTQCGVLPISESTGDVEIRSYINSDPDRLQQVVRRKDGVLDYQHSAGADSYDVARRLIKLTTLDSTLPWRFEYTGTHLSGVVDPDEAARIDFDKDSLGRPSQLSRYVDASSKQTQTYTYGSPFSTLPTLIGFGHNGSSFTQTQVVYDDFGRIVEVVVPETGAPGSPHPTRYEYDAAGRLVGARVGVGASESRVTTYGYDSLGRLTAVDHDSDRAVNCASQGAGTPIQDEEYGYDLCAADAPAGYLCSGTQGRLAVARAVVECGPGGQPSKRGRWYGYDAGGRLAQVVFATVLGAATSPPAVMSYSYTADGRLTEYTSPLNSSFGTKYEYAAIDGRVTSATTASGAPIAHQIAYRSQGQLAALSTPIAQPSQSGERSLQLETAHRTDGSLAGLHWALRSGTGGTATPIDLMAQAFSYAPSGAMQRRSDGADHLASRYYRHDYLHRLTCELRGKITAPHEPPSSACVADGNPYVAGLFTYGGGESVSTPPDVRLTSYVRSENAGQAPCSAVSGCYASPSIETSTYSSGSRQVLAVTRTGSTQVFGYDSLGRRTFEYDSFAPTSSRRNYGYLPNGQLGSVSGQTPDGSSYSYAIRYDERGLPVTIDGEDSYELFWDETGRLVAVEIAISPRGQVEVGAQSSAVVRVRWHYHYLAGTLLAATRELVREVSGGGEEPFVTEVKRFWAVADERGLLHRLVDEQGATYWQARWDATGARTLVGTPQPEMWVPFGLPGQVVLGPTQVYQTESLQSRTQSGTEAFASGSGNTWTRPPIALNQWRAYDPLHGAFLQPDPADQEGRADPEGYLYGRSIFADVWDPDGNKTLRPTQVPRGRFVWTPTGSQANRPGAIFLPNRHNGRFPTGPVGQVMEAAPEPGPQPSSDGAISGVGGGSDDDCIDDAPIGKLYLPGKAGFFAVAFAVRVTPDSYGKSRDNHFAQANRALLDAFKDAPFARMAHAIGINIEGFNPSQENAPTGWSWHHATQSQASGEPGWLFLVSRSFHTSNSGLFHPVLPGTGRRGGGFKEWGPDSELARRCCKVR